MAVFLVVRRFVSAMVALVMVFSLSTSALAADKAGEKAKQQFIDEIAKLQPFMRVDDDGYFQMSARSAKEAGVSAKTFGAVKAQFAEINSELKRLSEDERRQAFRLDGGDGGVHAKGCFTGTVPKWAIQGFAWIVIIYGGVSATVGLFASGTIIGLPAGAVLGALGVWMGITGSLLLWLCDNDYLDRNVSFCW